MFFLLVFTTCKSSFTISTTEAWHVICAGKAAQMYLTAVTGHVYGAYLVTLQPFAWHTKGDAEQYCMTAGGFWGLLCSTLRSVARRGVCLHCAFCGETKRVKPEQQAHVNKVSHLIGIYYYIDTFSRRYGIGTSSWTFIASLHSPRFLYFLHHLYGIPMAFQSHWFAKRFDEHAVSVTRVLPDQNALIPFRVSTLI